MAFDRKEFGMDSNIPFIKVADRVEVSVVLKAKRVSGPPLASRKWRSSRTLSYSVLTTAMSGSSRGAPGRGLPGAA
jgi:hypothetical protein